MTVGSTVTISGDRPSAGISPCTTVYNFYPSDSSGDYVPGRIYINRYTGGQLGGLTLAPEGNIYIHLSFSNALFLVLTYTIFIF